jgi:hypothetical protein
MNIAASTMVKPPQDVPSNNNNNNRRDGSTDEFDENEINHNRHVLCIVPKKKAAEVPPVTKDNRGEGQQRTDNNSKNVKRRRSDLQVCERRGDRGKAADIVERSRNYCRERTVTFAASLHRRHAARGAVVSSPSCDQYCIPPPDESNSIVDAFFHLCSLGFEDVASWVYAASFWMVLLFFLALYLLFVWIFAGFLLVAERFSPTQCIANDDISEEDLITRRHILEFAFALSWTTFTTVGYGRIAPPGDEEGCYPTRFICSIEAIIGMGFVSMCSGVFYAKLLRFLGSAPVTFSSILCVQYGKGLSDRTHNMSDSSINTSDLDDFEDEDPDDCRFRYTPPSFVDKSSFNPFPVIEFRIVNNRANCPPGKNEIWDAHVAGIVELPLESCDTDANRNSLPFEQHATIEKINCDLKLSPSFHPYFCRTWFLRHTLNESSPLLKEDIRDHLKARGPQKGWDATLNNYRDIRKVLVEFTSIRIMMSGSSALTKGEVYAEKTYTYDDLFIGWKFVGICFEDEEQQNSNYLFPRNKLRSSEEKTRVDLSLLHDICPQKGADYEPMVTGDEVS